eukprot:11612696-Alexandrium_andersonii.AAC.1
MGTRGRRPADALGTHIANRTGQTRRMTSSIPAATNHEKWPDRPRFAQLPLACHATTRCSRQLSQRWGSTRRNTSRDLRVRE